MSAAGGCYQRVTANGILQLHQWFIGQYVNNYVHQAPGCLCDCGSKTRISPVVHC